MGNTCFMNAAIQCLSNTRHFAQFFLSNRHLAEINPRNPLGTRGALSKRFGRLIAALWKDVGRPDVNDGIPLTDDVSSETESNEKKSSRRSPSAIRPSSLKNAIGRYAPQFEGYSQHDAQEFLSFLLDGLHEDLNQALKEPIPDTSIGEDLEPQMDDKEESQKSWSVYQTRNKSMIVDLFHGQLRSTLSCAECGYRSTTFEACTYLSLPIPVQAFRVVQATFIFLDGHRPPVQYAARLPTQARIRDIKEQFEGLSGVAADRMVVADMIGAHMFRVVNDEMSLLALREKDILVVYEMAPIHSPLSSMFTTTHTPNNFENHHQIEGSSDVAEEGGSRSDHEEGLLHICVIHRLLQSQQVYFLQPFKPVLFGTPFVVSVDPIAHTIHDLSLLMYRHARRHLKSSTVYGPIRDPQSNRLKIRAPYEIKLVNQNGTGCGICPWTKFCLGCCIDPSASSPSSTSCCGGEELVANLVNRANSRYLTLALDWSNETVKEYRGEKNAPIVHPSIEASWAAHNIPISLQQCLLDYTREELLDIDQLWNCKDCRDFRQARKKISLWRTAPFVVVHLKRFCFNGANWHKLTSLVTFPVDLDLSTFNPYSSQETQENSHYRLYAVLNHYGGTGGGHYTCFGRNWENDKWYSFNDTICEEINDLESLVTSAAYVLFYERVDLPALNILSPPIIANAANPSKCRIM
eukprot:TRINITY_DN4926_c0_g1_i1.p1 TRINITY_DN4926_c0_g1~~TRINITY_DN4926_c0_g1_i1.p1  ORF type:complete len:741 (-),score=121.36 TRINITY_DN4926_c0_g1_i1:40-2112(-)